MCIRDSPDTAANRIRTSDVTDPNVDFLTGFDQKITYGYVVHAVNGDLVESADSNTVTVQDVIAVGGLMLFKIPEDADKNFVQEVSL